MRLASAVFVKRTDSKTETLLISSYSSFTVRLIGSLVRHVTQKFRLCRLVRYLRGLPCITLSNKVENIPFGWLPEFCATQNVRTVVSWENLNLIRSHQHGRRWLPVRPFRMSGRGPSKKSGLHTKSL